MNQLYPLKFAPLCKDKIWGGSKLKDIFSKEGASSAAGESWELSGYEGDESVVNNGFLAGNNLVELIEVYMGDLVGDKIYDKFGLSFPLLFKLIDANDKLSIQVHPWDEVAMDRHQSFGKTEMWYVVDADPGSELIIGFKKDCTRDEYLLALNEGRVEELLQPVPVKKGDVFFIPAGLVHAIGKGVVVAEIQQTSDITYRIYDYKRVDDQGKERDLHTAEALDVINFNGSPDPGTAYEAKANEVCGLVSCEYFTTNMLVFNQTIGRSYVSLDSFVAYMCLEGAFSIVAGDSVTAVKTGETVLIPAIIDEVKLKPATAEVKLLEVYIA